MFLFLETLFQNYLFALIPVFAMLGVFIYSCVLAFQQRKFPLRLRLLSMAGAFLLTIFIFLETLQPIVQVYLEENLNVIFLEANKYTGLMRNLRYLVYPLGMFTIGFALFDDRFEESEVKE